MSDNLTWDLFLTILYFCYDRKKRHIKDDNHEFQRDHA